MISEASDSFSFNCLIVSERESLSWNTPRSCSTGGFTVFGKFHWWEGSLVRNEPGNEGSLAAVNSPDWTDQYAVSPCVRLSDWPTGCLSLSFRVSVFLPSIPSTLQSPIGPAERLHGAGSEPGWRIRGHYSIVVHVCVCVRVCVSL